MAVYGESVYGESAYGEDAGDPGAIPAATLSMVLSGYALHAAVSLPMRLVGQTGHAAVSLPMRLESADPAHFTAASAAWTPAVDLGGVDISAQVLGAIRIEHEEDSSGICSLSFIPSAGSIDPDNYENQPLSVSFVGLDSSGAELYRVRRYTGTVERAAYDPDNGVLNINATTDLQGLLENTSREGIDIAIGGQWSEHVFDEGADGYQYALDRLSTRLAEMHVDNYGRLEVVDWAAKATADVEFTDAARFNDTLRLDRAQRRDLVTRVNIAMDFRFVRLRHREIRVHFVDQLGFCHYLDNNWKLPSKDMVAGGADGAAWTRISDIVYQELPGPGEYCTPTRGWGGNADAFCLGASWTAARRWAQTVTEEYSLTVFCPDMEEVAGVQLVPEGYGIEATYDATDYERMDDFSTSPGGAVYNPASEDWELDATASETDGRTAMEAAQECALAKARNQILGRARRNRVTFSPVYRPDITLANTVRVNTPGLVAKGKVAKIIETLDPGTGLLDMELSVALSRHGGSGLAANDTLDPAPEPSPPSETSTGRIYTMGYHLGQTTSAPADNDEWDGYIVNVASNGVLYDATGPTYRERFVVRMPEIEEAARNAVAVQGAQTYQVQVPQDELTMSA